MPRTRAHAICRAVLPAAAIVGLAALLGGCVAYPAYPGYGYYGPGYGYPAGGYVAFDGGWGGHGGGWDGGWHR